MGKRKKFGFSFSLKRALGLSAMKGKASRKIGIPLTKQGRERKAGRIVLGMFGLGGRKRSKRKRSRAKHVRW